MVRITPPGVDPLCWPTVGYDSLSLSSSKSNTDALEMTRRAFLALRVIGMQWKSCREVVVTNV